MQSINAIQCQHPKFFARSSETLSTLQSDAATIGADDVIDTDVALPVAEHQEEPLNLEDVLKLSLFAISGALHELTGVVSRITTAVESSTPNDLLAANVFYFLDTLNLIENQYADKVIAIFGRNDTLQNSRLC